MPVQALTTRFAPSPTGLLHLGHAFAAFVAQGHARRTGGRFLLRIDDLDHTRCRPQFERAIYEDLAWLGLNFELPVRRQSDHFPEYARAIETLRAQGLLYPCFCTRANIAAEIQAIANAPQGPEGPLYPRTCLALSAGERRTLIESGRPFAWRLDTEKAAKTAGPLDFLEHGAGPLGEVGRITADPGLLGDIVLARKEMPASYHLACVIDDSEQGVTLVTRGEDLFAATHIQRLLQALLKRPRPEYAHHRLICDASGRRLAKRDAAMAVSALRAQGASAADVRRMVE